MQENKISSLCRRVENSDLARLNKQNLNEKEGAVPLMKKTQCPVCRRQEKNITFHPNRAVQILH